MKKMSFLLSVILVLSLQATPAQQSDPVQLMDKSRDLTMSGNIQSTVSLTITEKNGAVRMRKLNMITKSYDDGTIKRMVKFLDPPDVRGTAMLIIDNENTQDDMWIYLPALKKTRRIVSSEKGKSFMSSEFSNADMSTGSNADFRMRHMPESGKDGSWIIESVPVSEDKADEYGYSRKITYLETGSLKTKRIDFFNFDNELFKTIEILATQPLTGKEGYVMTDMLATNHLNGRSSRVKFEQVNTSAAIADNTFSVESLTR